MVNSKSSDNLNIFYNIEKLKDFIVSHKLWDDLKGEFLKYQITILGWHYHQTPEENLLEYKSRCEKILNKKDYKKMLSLANEKKNFLEQIFSIKNLKKDGIKRKVITFLGVKFILLPNRKEG